jgi:hypothetical protein
VAQTLLSQSDPVNLLPLTQPVTHTGEDAPADTSSGAPEGFEMETLDEVGGDFAGPLTPQNGGLQPSLWRGSSRGKIERLLARLPLHHSPALASLTRTLLLTNASPPPGQGTGVNILALRARILAEMGFRRMRAPAHCAGAGNDTASQVLVTLLAILDVDGACAALLRPPRRSGSTGSFSSSGYSANGAAASRAMRNSAWTCCEEGATDPSSRRSWIVCRQSR